MSASKGKTVVVNVTSQMGSIDDNKSGTINVAKPIYSKYDKL